MISERACKQASRRDTGHVFLPLPLSIEFLQTARSRCALQTGANAGVQHLKRAGHLQMSKSEIERMSFFYVRFPIKKDFLSYFRGFLAAPFPSLLPRIRGTLQRSVAPPPAVCWGSGAVLPNHLATPGD